MLEALEAYGEALQVVTGIERKTMATPHLDPFELPWGKIIIRERSRLGMRQCDLAAKAGVAPQHFVCYEKGRVRPHPDTIVRIAVALGMAGWELFKMVEDERFNGDV